MGEIKVSPDYNWFRSTVPLKKIIVDDDDSKIWSLYDAGPRNIRCPLIFLPPVSGTADVFFRQILALTGWGYRVIALQYPVYWDHLEFCDGFRKLLDHLQLDKVHLFGASLGGFWPRSLLNTLTNLPESSPSSSVMPSVTLLSLIKRGLPTAFG